VNDIFKFFTDNWSAIEGLARNLVADLGVLWGLGLAFAQVLKKLKPEWGRALEKSTLGVIGAKGMDMDD